MRFRFSRRSGPKIAGNDPELIIYHRAFMHWHAICFHGIDCTRGRLAMTAHRHCEMPAGFHSFT